MYVDDMTPAEAREFYLDMRKQLGDRTLTSSQREQLCWDLDDLKGRMRG